MVAVGIGATAIAMQARGVPNGGDAASKEGS